MNAAGDDGGTSGSIPTALDTRIRTSHRLNRIHGQHPAPENARRLSQQSKAPGAPSAPVLPMLPAATRPRRDGVQRVGAICPRQQASTPPLVHVDLTITAPTGFSRSDSIASIVAVATLTIRNLDDELRRKLKVRAAGHDRSMEAEVRVILAAAVAEADELATTASPVAALPPAVLAPA